MKTTCKKSWPVNLTSDNILCVCVFCIVLTTEVVPTIFPGFNAHIVVPLSWGFCLPRLA